MLNCFNLQEDSYYSHTKVQDLLWDTLYLTTEPLLTRWPLNKLIREIALKKTMELIHYEDQNSRYITNGCVMKVTVHCPRDLGCTHSFSCTKHMEMKRVDIFLTS